MPPPPLPLRAPRILVIEHEELAPVAWLGERWRERGAVVDVVRGFAGDPVPPTLGDHDALVVLGGYMGADDDHEHAWLTDTKALIRHTATSEATVLGVCLGHQLTASALGGRVGRNPAGRTIGLTRVSLTTAGGTDPLLTGFGGARAIHYNDDVILELPSGATVLATTPDGAPQAVRYGRRVWGVQFHPEVSPEIFEQWAKDEPDEMRRGEITGPALAARTELRETWREFADRFLEQFAHPDPAAVPAP